MSSDWHVNTLPFQLGFSKAQMHYHFSAINSIMQSWNNCSDSFHNVLGQTDNSFCCGTNPKQVNGITDIDVWTISLFPERKWFVLGQMQYLFVAWSLLKFSIDYILLEETFITEERLVSLSYSKWGIIKIFQAYTPFWFLIFCGLFIIVIYINQLPGNQNAF